MHAGNKSMGSVATMPDMLYYCKARHNNCKGCEGYQEKPIDIRGQGGGMG